MTAAEPFPDHDIGPLFAGDGDTIVAIATGAGRGALAMIRLSGPDAHALGRALASRWPAHARVATRTPIHDRNGVQLDDAVVVRYDAPASFTGEDAVEVIAHGGTVVPATITAAAIDLGARQALPGEFTRRAIFNGKLDLLQAEATGDLVAATSRAAQRAALHQLHGGLSVRISELRTRLIETEALLAYDIDFPEEDDGPLPPARVLESLEHCERVLVQLLSTSKVGGLVRDGALVVLAGVPNAGKSSLFNALLGQERAIVTDLPGTTRDAIEAVVDTGRWPLRLVDTAGLRESGDQVERLGIAASTRYLESASIVLVCGANARELESVLSHVASSTAPRLFVATKSDLNGIDATELNALAQRHHVAGACRVSAATAAGLEALTHLVMTTLDTAVELPDDSAPILTRARHHQALSRALDEVRAFRRAWSVESVPAIVAAVHLRSGVAALEELIGVVDVDQILDELFSRFCVGK